MTDTFTYTPQIDPTGTTTLRVRKAQFGDGYMQTVADGINAKV
jgi:phage-related protein